MRSLAASILGMVSDAWIIGFNIFQVSFAALVSLVLWRLGVGQKRVDTTDERLHALTSKLVDERFRAMSHEVNGHVNGFMLTLEELKLRLKETEQTFDQLIRAGHVQEMKGVERLEQVKDYIRDQTASRQDLREHQKNADAKFDRIMQQMAEMQSAIAVVAERAQ